MERIERYEVATFIREARGVSSDPQAEQERLNALLAHARGAADRFLDEYYHADPSHNPFQIAQKETVAVANRFDPAALAQELRSALDRTAARSERRALRLAEPLGSGTGDGDRAARTRADTIVSNPIGFYVDRISWTEATGLGAGKRRRAG